MSAASGDSTRPSAAPLPPPATLGTSGAERLARALRGPGLWLDVGAAVLHVQGRSAHLAAQLQAVYAEFPRVEQADWAEVHVRMDPPPGLRRWLRPQVQFVVDGRTPFEPFPADHALPMMEWGSNMLIGQRLNHLLLLHAGVVERDGCALVLPATPGSGKSTLAAALSLSGWRLLSDEFGALDPQALAFVPMLKPVALKNRSIDVIRALSSAARLGPEFAKTRKGTVAHLVASAEAVRRRHETARPGAVVLPRWVEGSATEFTPVPALTVFRSVAFNAFNYQTLGAAGFRAAVAMARQCRGWQLTYSRLDEALALLERAWPAMRAGEDPR